MTGGQLKLEMNGWNVEEKGWKVEEKGMEEGRGGGRWERRKFEKLKTKKENNAIRWGGRWESTP